MCPLGGSFPATSDISWPTCIIEHCIDIPALSGFVKKSNDPVKVGAYAYYECVTNGHVTDNGQWQKLLCNADGTINTEDVSDWPECREPVECAETSPEPSGDSGLKPNNATVTLEFQSATYYCDAYHEIDINNQR